MHSITRNLSRLVAAIHDFYGGFVSPLQHVLPLVCLIRIAPSASADQVHLAKPVHLQEHAVAGEYIGEVLLA